MAKTDNGRVTHEGPLTIKSAGKTRLEGALGGGGQVLKLETHNGSVTIKAAG